MHTNNSISCTDSNENTVLGDNAGNVTPSGSMNTAFGAYSLTSTPGNSNVSVGFQSMQSAASCNNCVGVGANSLLNNTSDGNTALGYNALTANTSGSNNLAIGANSLLSNTTGTGHIGIGTNAVKSTLTDSDNIGIGTSALENTNGGSNNVAIGSLALSVNTTGSDNTAVGYAALYQNSTGTQNTAVGFLALENNTTANGNSAFGTEALRNLTTGTNNVAVGMSALITATTQGNNTAVGVSSLANNTSGNNTAVGYNSMAFSGTSTNNVAIGRDCLSTGSGDDNVAIGLECMQQNSGIFNVAVGVVALTNNTGSSNTCIGYDSMSAINTGSQNSTLGSNALQHNTSGASNVALGYTALAANTSGANNVAVGAAALNSTTTLSGLVAVGYQSQKNNTSGAENTGVGNNSLQSNTSGNYNVALGSSSLSSLTAGSSNIAIGRDSGSSYNSSESGNILIDNVGVNSESSVTRIGTSQAQCYVKGIAGNTVSNLNIVTIDTSTGQLGSQAPAGNTYYSLTPYIVGPSGDVNAQFTGDTGIQDAINQAVTDGASAGNVKNIYIKPGTYNPSGGVLTVPNGVNLIGFDTSGTISSFVSPSTTVNSAVVLVDGSSVQVTAKFIGIAFVSASNPCFQSDNSMETVSISLESCTLSGFVTAFFNDQNDGFSFTIQVDNCLINVTGNLIQSRVSAASTTVLDISYSNAIADNTMSDVVASNLTLNIRYSDITANFSSSETPASFQANFFKSSHSSGTNLLNFTVDGPSCFGQYIDCVLYNNIVLTGNTCGLEIDNGFQSSGTINATGSTGYVRRSTLCTSNDTSGLLSAFKTVPDYNGSDEFKNSTVVVTTDNTPTVLASVVVNEVESIVFEGKVIAAVAGNPTSSVGGTFMAVANRQTGGNIALVGLPIINVMAGSTETFTVAVDTGTQTIRVVVTGVAATTYNWITTYTYQKMTV